ncbi:hypothetical protein [Amycolatopsis nigrescens]|uniref:hypothetical protein n=1 Tax=Amycolatopsis nigrescens TaxID=381445 RepID=UPI00036282B4|nr:hypothetical protein [Amycolatopsis nigrescens]
MQNQIELTLAIVASETGDVLHQFIDAPRDVEQQDPEAKVHLGGPDSEVIARAGLTALYEPAVGEHDKPADLCADCEMWVPYCAHCGTVLLRPDANPEAPYPYPPNAIGTNLQEVWCKQHPRPDRRRPHAAVYRILNFKTKRVMEPGPALAAERAKDHAVASCTYPDCQAPMPSAAR